MKKTIMFVFLASLLTFGLCQGFAGGELPHLYTGSSVAQLANQILPTVSYTTTLSRPQFDAGEQVNIATVLQDYTYFSTASQSGSTVPYVHIQVLNPTLSANQQIFSYNLRTIQTPANVANFPYKIKRVRLNFIIVGANFGGSYTNLPSSYLFARNSILVAPAAAGNTLVDFRLTPTSTQTPFSYAVNNTVNIGCGAVKRNGNWIIERAGCQVIRAAIFITGLDMNVPVTGSLINTFKVGATAGIPNEVIFNLAAAQFTPDITQDGLPLVLNAGNVRVNLIQLSMIVFGLREYTANIYPIQGVSIDNFIVSTFVNPTLSNFAPGTSTFTDTATNVQFPNSDSLPSTNFGHRICGLTGFSTTVSAAPTTIGSTNDAYVGFVIDVPEPNPNLNSASLPQTLVTSLFNAGGVNNVLSGLRLAETCIVFTAKNPCAQTPVGIPINSQTVQINPTTSAITTAFAGVPGAPYATSGDPNVIQPVNVLASHTIPVSTTGTITYGAQIPANLLKVGAYEGVLHISAGGVVPVATFTVSLNIFGNALLTRTFSVDNTRPSVTYHFAFQNNNLASNAIVVTYTIVTPTTTTPLSQVIEFGLIYHNNVLSVNQTCSNNCVSITGFGIGVDYSTIPPTCITCDTSLNLIFDPVGRVCICAPGYFVDSNGLCQVCTSPLCGSCTSSATTCNSCPTNAQFINPANTALGCQCKTGFYRAGIQCLPCAPGCVNCTTGTSCTTCVANSNTRTTTLNCPCLPGFFETGAPICPTCAPECLTCSVSATNCTSCNATGLLVPTGTTCTCADGYYLATVNGQIQCLPCYFGCATCVGDAANCINCQSAQWTKNHNGQCICNRVLKLVQYANQTVRGICIDQVCADIDPNCVSCSIILANGRNICTGCNTLLNFTLAADNVTCVCRAGFLLVNGNCVPCGNGCQTCNPVTTCVNCALGAFNNGNGTCTCPVGTYVANVFGTLQCMPCDLNCAQCQITSSTCTRCINGFTTAANFTCLCPAGNFVSLDGVNCLPCSTGCTQCTSATTCSSCSSAYILANGACVLNCPAGTFNAGNQCTNCSAGCTSCESALICRACSSGLVLYLASCRQTCPTGTFTFGNTLCVACSETCNTCSQARNNCTSCSSTLVLHNSQCIQNCPNGTYLSAGICISCQSPCLTCSGNATTCISCPNNQFLFNSQCFTQCPTAIVGGVCTNICPAGQYLVGTTCQRCSPSCRTCSAPNLCTSCNTGFNYQGQCQPTCPPKTINSGGICLDCDFNCVSCSVITTNCSACVPGTYRLDSRCYSVCPTAHYTDFSTLTCKPCDANCRTCAGPGQCSACIDGSLPTNGLCAVNCGSNCLVCQGSTCTSCAANFFWNGASCQPSCPSGAIQTSAGVCVCQNGLALSLGVCVSTCPAGTVNVNNVCTACQSPCQTCVNSVTTCSSCIAGFTFDPVSRTCVQATNCPYGQYSSTFGDCRYVCGEGNFFLDFACYVGTCPTGYTADARNRVCIKVSPITGCTAPFFAQGRVCVTTCDSGFYADTDTRVCTPCSSGCASCSNPTTCTSCVPGTVLINNTCVVQAANCPGGQAIYNGNCISTCPTGTFNNNGYCSRLCAANLYWFNRGCYSICPTNLNTVDACVVVCPVGTSRLGNTCLASTQTCPGNQYFNTALGVCDNCRFPCTSCAGSATFCLLCAPNFNLNNGGICLSATSCSAGTYPTQTGCATCPSKCAACSNATTCTSCASGFVSSGSDCIPNTITLLPVTLRNIATVKDSNNVVFIQIQATIIPNNLPSALASQIVLFVPSIPNPASRVTIWVNDGFIFVALTHSGPIIPSYQATLILNSNVFDGMYRAMGYSTSNAFVQIPINNNINIAPINLVIPPTASNAVAFSLSSLQRVYNSNLNREAIFAVRQVDSLSL